MSAHTPTQGKAPEADSRDFRRCLGQFATGVTVITAEHAGQRVGVTANSFSSLSLDPPLVLWSIARTSRAFETFQRAPTFAINILASDQIDLSQRFSSKEEDKFATVDWQNGENGAPVLAGTSGYLECTTQTLHDGGDHVLIIGRVSAYHIGDRDGLIFAQGRYCVGMDHPMMHSTASGKEGEAPFSPSNFGTLLFEAHRSSSDGFAQHRHAEGLTFGESRLLYGLSHAPSLSKSALIERTALPIATVDDALSALSERGEVARDQDGNVSLTDAGKIRRETISKRVALYETKALDGISLQDLSITRRVLARFAEQLRKSAP